MFLNGRYAARRFASGEIFTRGIYQSDDAQMITRGTQECVRILLEDLGLDEMSRRLRETLSSIEKRNRRNMIPLMHYVKTRRLKKPAGLYKAGSNEHAVVAKKLPVEFHRAGAYIPYVLTPQEYPNDKRVDCVKPAVELFSTLDTKFSKLEVGVEIDRDAYFQTLLQRVQSLLPCRV